eukprot:2678535-Ditylum_brightwellii.AAC.1
MALPSRYQPAMAITAELITTSFPHSVILRLPGDPTYRCIYKVNKSLSKNAGSVHSTLGDSGHGILGLTIRPTDDTREMGMFLSHSLTHHSIRSSHKDSLPISCIGKSSDFMILIDNYGNFIWPLTVH